MTDTLSPKNNRPNMALIRSKNTKPELLVRKFLFSRGLRYLLHDKRLPGKPDIVLPKHRTIIQVHGCFWHGHIGCKLNRLPKSKPDYWKPKLELNALRDNLNKIELERLGWRVLTIWECQLRGKTRVDSLNSLYNLIKE